MALVKDLNLDDELYLARQTSSIVELQNEFNKHTMVYVNDEYKRRLDTKVVASSEFFKLDEVDQNTLYVLSDDFIDMNYNEIRHLKSAENGDEAVNLAQLSSNYVSKVALWSAISSSTTIESLMDNLKTYLV